MKNKIKIQNLNFSFDKDNQILNDLSLSMDKGDFLSVLGASGSGKSTLLRVLSNILPANKSQMLEGNVSIFGKTPKEYLDTGKLSFMFQEASLMPNLNVKENIVFPLKLRRENIDSSFVNELLELVGLNEHSFKFPSELSGGMKTRVSLARAFVTKPELLLLDEPFSALDISWKYELYNYLVRFSKRFNTSLIFVTHDVQESVLLSNKIIVISKNGKLLTQRIVNNNPKFFDYDSVNSFLKSNTDTILGVQTDILINNKRLANTLESSISTLNWVLGLIYKGQGNENDPLVFDRLNGIRLFVNKPDVKTKLIEAFRSSKSWKFKFEALWPLMDIKSIDYDVQELAYGFIKSNWDEFVKEIKGQNYFHPSEVFFKIKERIEDENYPDAKTWLYLNYLFAYTVETNQISEAEIFIKNFLQNRPSFQYSKFVEPLIYDYEK